MTETQENHKNPQNSSNLQNHKNQPVLDKNPDLKALVIVTLFRELSQRLKMSESRIRSMIPKDKLKIILHIFDQYSDKEIYEWVLNPHKDTEPIMEALALLVLLTSKRKLRMMTGNLKKSHKRTT